MEIEELLGRPLPANPDYRLGDADEIRGSGDVRTVPVYFGDEEITAVSAMTGDDLLRAAEQAAETHKQGLE